MAERIQEVNDVKAALAETQASLQKKEVDIARIHKMVPKCAKSCLFRRYYQ